MIYRVIVTGCRDWTDERSIDRALSAEFHPYTESGDFVIVHGACPTGADAMARDWAHALDLEDEPHPADWIRLGKAAGFARNTEMATLGADICLAFWDGKSPGTQHMISQAVKHGIPVRIIPKGNNA